MAEPYLSEIRLFSFNFPPRGWAFADGQLLSISQNSAIYGLIGTTYGGDGVTNFALPDYRGRVPMHTGVGHVHGESGGGATHTLTNDEMPRHTHIMQAVDPVGSSVKINNPTNGLLSNSKPINLYQNAVANPSALHQNTISTVGNNQPHTNMQPYLTINFCIALYGIFPSRN